MMLQYVYIVRPREFIRLNEETYKIGKTTQPPNSRLAGYPKGSEVLAFISVNDCSAMETKIKERFIVLFTQRKEYGVEYFHGDIDHMLKVFMDIVSNDKFLVCGNDDSDEEYDTKDEPYDVFWQIIERPHYQTNERVFLSV